MAKLNRERAVRERRERKQARKDERKRAAAEPQPPADFIAPEGEEGADAPPPEGGELRESMD